MADIKRTSTDLITNLFQDGQAANSINEQDLRDFIASLVMPFGGASMGSNATETTINTVNTFENIAGTFAAGSALAEITVNTSGGVLTYTGTPDRHFHVVANLAFIAASNNVIMRAQWHKNGTTTLPAYVGRKVATGADVGAMSVHADVQLSTNDTLELKVANGTDASNLTVQDIYVFAMGMFI